MATDDVAKLRSEIDALKKDLGEISGTLKGIASSRVNEEKNRILDEISLDEIKNKINSLKMKGAEELDYVEKTIASNPFKSVAITFGIGMIAAMLMSKK